MRNESTQILAASKPIFKSMDSTGIRIDLAELHRCQVRAEAELQAILKPYGVKLVVEFKRIIESKIRKLADWPRTEKGAISLAAEVLRARPEVVFHNYAKAVSVQREASTLSSLISKLRDGRLYPEHRVEGWIGRVYVAGFNYTNLPERDRGIVLADDDESSVWVIDVKSCELVALAVLAGDESLLRDLAESDFHSTVAGRLQVDRKVAKVVSFSIVFGATEYFLAREIGISVERARELLSGYFDFYPNVRDFLSKIRANGALTGYARTFFGSIRNFPVIEGCEKSVVSHVIQSTAAEVVRIGLTEADRQAKLEGCRIFGSLFDSFLVSVPNSNPGAAERIAAAAERTMLEAGFPMKTEIKGGDRSWS